MSGKTELIVALDFPDEAVASALLKQCADLPVLWKIGSELFLAVGPSWVRAQTDQGRRVFLDLKFHDIPHTVAQASRRAWEMGVEMFTLHLAGGAKMVQGVREEFSSKGAAHGKPAPKVLGVSVLTSFDQQGWNEIGEKIGGNRLEIKESVRRLASDARHWGADGLVCSPHEIETVRRIDPKLYLVIPGIRPEGSEVGDQARTMTPAQAARQGAHAIVVGRPITRSPDPRKVIEQILQDLHEAGIK